MKEVMELDKYRTERIKQMVIGNEYFKERREVTGFLADNINVFKVTYFKESGKYYTEAYYELIHGYGNGIWKLPDHFIKYCNDYKEMYAVIEFNDNHPSGYPFMLLAKDRR